MFYWLTGYWLPGCLVAWLPGCLVAGNAGKEPPKRCHEIVSVSTESREFLIDARPFQPPRHLCGETDYSATGPEPRRFRTIIGSDTDRQGRCDLSTADSYKNTI